MAQAEARAASVRDAIRPGRAGKEGHGFGRQVAVQPSPVEAGSLWPEDLDGDGLDELIIYDVRDPAGDVFVLRNRGILPGSPRQAVIEATPPRSDRQ